MATDRRQHGRRDVKGSVLWKLSDLEQKHKLWLDVARFNGEFFIPPDRPSGWLVFGTDREPRVREPINSFEGALFLDPESRQAKGGLAGCLAAEPNRSPSWRAPFRFCACLGTMNRRP